MAKIWPEIYVELLIENIRKYEVLWNTKHPEYTIDNRVRHRFWKEFMKQFNEVNKTAMFTLHDIMYKWKRLRIKFEKEQKLISDLKKDSSSWRHYNSLTFLIPHPSRRRKKPKIIPKKYSLRGKVGNREQSDADTEVCSVSPLNVRHDDKNVSVTQMISLDDSCTKSDDETEYVSIGSVSPPCMGQGFCFTSEEF